MTRRIPVAVLGATGTVGQKFVRLLAEHPWFELVAVAAPDRYAIEDGRVASDRGLDIAPDEYDEHFVEEHVGRPLRIDYRWAGIFGMVFDFVPVVGRVPGDERLWVAGGYSGHGNVLGFACGRLAARAIVGDRDPLLDVFEPSRLLVH